MDLTTQQDAQGNAHGFNQLVQAPLQQAQHTPRMSGTEGGRVANTLLQTPQARPHVEVCDMFIPASAARPSEAYDAAALSPGSQSDTLHNYAHVAAAYVVIPSPVSDANEWVQGHTTFLAANLQREAEWLKNCRMADPPFMWRHV